MIARPPELTEEQRRIVEAEVLGPYVVDAGAGTGKTFTLVHRATRLVREGMLKPSELLVVTFMKKAATEIGERLMIAFSEQGISEFPTCTTIHALGAMLIREFAYESGVSPDARAIDDLRARGVFLKAYGDLLNGSLGVDLSAFPLLERSEILPRSLATLALSLKNQGISVDEFERDALAAADSLKALPFNQLYKVGKIKPRTDVAPKTPLTPAELAFESAQETLNVRVVAALFRRFDTYLDRESLLTYGDLLTRAISILKQSPRIAERLRSRWRHALVDEFQDTNPQQLGLLRAIFGDDLRPVMAVGDIRQAIFEWNGADPTGIRKVADAGGTRTFTLSRNRRSPQQILDAAHTMLPANDLYRGEGLTAERGHAPEICVRHGLFAREASIDESRVVEATAIATEIRMLFERGVQSKDIAILLRSRSKARLYAGVLADHGIGTKTHGGAGFFDAPEIADAIAWLRLLEDPSDAFALTRLLEGPSFGISDGTLAKLYTPAAREDNVARTQRLLNDPLPAWLLPVEHARLERFRSINRKLAKSIGRPLVEALRNVLAETGIDIAQSAARLVLTAQIQANIAKLVALAMGFAADRPLATITDFIGEIDEREELEMDEPEAQASGNQIAIMTVHAAKGLEWDYVFVANVSDGVFPSRSTGGGEVVAMRDEATKALAMRYDLDGDMPFRWLMAKTPHNPATGVKLEKIERDEERRLFYVALTRAKRAIWISGSGTGGKSSTYLTELTAHTTAVGSGADFGATATEPVTATAIEPNPSELRDGSRLLDRLTRVGELFEPPALQLSYTAIATFTTCPRLARYRYRLRVPDLRTCAVSESVFETEDRPTDHMDAATFGTAVHRALELCMQDRIDGNPPDVDGSVQVTLDELGPAIPDDIRGRLRAATRYAVEALHEYTPIAVEREFYVTIAGVQVGGFIDLIARDPSGSVTVIDYKTGHQPDTSYALQLALYCRAVHDELGETAAAILRVADDGAQFERPALPSQEAVERDVKAARTMSDDTPRTGVQCLGCAYAGPLCPEGAAAAAR